VARQKKRRAKAVVDFEKHDEDELGFSKNDIINVRLCWVKNQLLWSAIVYLLPAENFSSQWL